MCRLCDEGGECYHPHSCGITPTSACASILLRCANPVAAGAGSRQAAGGSPKRAHSINEVEIQRTRARSGSFEGHHAPRQPAALQHPAATATRHQPDIRRHAPRAGKATRSDIGLRSANAVDPDMLSPRARFRSLCEAPLCRRNSVLQIKAGLTGPRIVNVLNGLGCKAPHSLTGYQLPKSLRKPRKSATFTKIIPRTPSNPAMQDQTLRFHFSKATTPSY